VFLPVVLRVCICAYINPLKITKKTFDKYFLNNVSYAKEVLNTNFIKYLISEHIKYILRNHNIRLSPIIYLNTLYRETYIRYIDELIISDNLINEYISLLRSYTFRNTNIYDFVKSLHNCEYNYDNNVLYNHVFAIIVIMLMHKHSLRSFILSHYTDDIFVNLLSNKKRKYTLFDIICKINNNMFKINNDKITIRNRSVQVNATYNKISDTISFDNKLTRQQYHKMIRNFTAHNIYDLLLYALLNKMANWSDINYNMLKKSFSRYLFKFSDNYQGRRLAYDLENELIRAQ